MPPRLNKRQQRELEELEALGKAPAAEETSSEEEVSAPAPSTSSGFAAVSMSQTAHRDADRDRDCLPSCLQPKKRKNHKRVMEKLNLGLQRPRR